MRSARSLFLGLLVAGATVIPAGASPIIWNFGGSGGYNSGFTLSDNTTVSGTFAYDADINTPNCYGGGSGPCGGYQYASAGVAPQPEDYNGGFGLFGNGVVGGVEQGTLGGVTGSFTVSAGSVLSSLGIGSGTTWYINTNIYDSNSNNPTDCCADSTDVWLVDKNPATTANLAGAYGLQVYLNSAMNDSGNLYPTGDVITSVYGGICSDYACGTVFQNNDGTNVTLSDVNANVNTGQAPPPSGVPEPSTFLLGASVLAIGVWRRKSFLRR